MNCEPPNQPWKTDFDFRFFEFDFDFWFELWTTLSSWEDMFRQHERGKHSCNHVDTASENIIF